LFCRYRNAAKHHEREFNLTYEQVLALTSQECFYCGCPPSHTVSQKKYNGSYTYNGIDRVDSSKGYLVGNTVPCCRTCNLAKNNLTQEEFFLWVERVAGCLKNKGLLKS
jgi:hypothetical protein